MSNTITVSQINKCRTEILQLAKGNPRYEKIVVNLEKLQGSQLYKEIALICEFVYMHYGVEDGLLQLVMKHNIIEI